MFNYEPLDEVIDDLSLAFKGYDAWFEYSEYFGYEGFKVEELRAGGFAMA